MESPTPRSSSWRAPLLAVVLLATAVAAGYEWFFAMFDCHFGESPYDAPYTGRARLCHEAGSALVYAVPVLWLALAVAAVVLHVRWTRGRGGRAGGAVGVLALGSAVLPLALSLAVSP